MLVFRSVGEGKFFEKKAVGVSTKGKFATNDYTRSKTEHNGKQFSQKVGAVDNRPNRK